MAHKLADVAMLARTHGQPATPTTLGKELANFVYRLERQTRAVRARRDPRQVQRRGRQLQRARVAYPETRLAGVTDRFVESLGLDWTRYTTQIEPHDWIAEYCDALARFNTVADRPVPRLLGLHLLGLLPLATRLPGEVGSSTMPHKVNPIDFENAEGNLGARECAAAFFADKLPVSRWQRDLTDSTVLRNLGVALGHTLVALDACTRGLSKLDADPALLAADLEERWEVLAEPSRP